MANLKIAIFKHGDVCAELRSQLAGNEPPHSYISEIVNLSALGELHIAGHSSKAAKYQHEDVYCDTFHRGEALLSHARFYLDHWKYLRRVDPDVVVVLHPWELLVIPFVWCRIRKRKFLPCIPKLPASTHAGWVRKYFVKLVIRPLLRKSQVILVRSGPIQKQLNSWGIDDRRIIIYLPPYDKEFFACEKLLPTDNSDFNIVFIGRLVKLKGIYDLLKIFEQVLAKVPSAKLFVIGNGPEHVSMRQWAESRSIGASVTFIGEVPQKDIYGYLAPADVAVLPSYQEGLGKTALEALLAGVPVLATDGTGFSQFIRHGDNGFLFAPGHVGEFSNALIELYHDEEALARLKHGALGTREDIMNNLKTFASCVKDFVRNRRNC